MNNLSQLPLRQTIIVCVGILLSALIPSSSSLEILVSILTLVLIIMLLREDFGTEMRGWLMLAFCTYGIGVFIDLLDEIPELSDHWLVATTDDIFMHTGVFLICFCFIKMLHQRHRLIDRLHDQINKARDLEDELRRLTLQDDLTGVLNRRSLFQQFDQLAINLQQGMLASIVLDNFKQVNDIFGHRCGDKVLVDMASVLEDTSPSSSQVYRVGGVEFVVLLPSEEQVICYQWLDTLYTATAEARARYGFDISVGLIPYYPGNLSDPDSILAKANAAMYQQKQIQG